MSSNAALKQIDRLVSVDPAVFCKGMRHLAGHCAVIASGDTQHPAGLTATAVCSVTANPPRLLVCINRDVYAHRVIVETGYLSINILASCQESIAKCFAGMLEGVAATDRFQHGQWAPGNSGIPVMQDALVSFECQVTEAIPASTHDMFLCEVVGVAGKMSQDGPLIYFNGQFAALT